MREIKFRAWDKPNKRMLYFDTLGWHDEYSLLYFQNGELDVPCGDNLIIMQYTGLKDKNGKEIYEGDIIRTIAYNDTYDDGAIGNVTFESPSFRFNWKILMSKSGDKQHRIPISTICSTVGYNSDKIEIIGNIYENPELLKQ